MIAIARMSLRRGRMGAVRLAVACLLAALPTSAVLGSGSELHTFHCLHGCPLGAADIDDIVVREIYTLASNDLTKMAD